MSQVAKVCCVVWAKYENKKQCSVGVGVGLQSDQNINYEGMKADRSHKPNAE